MVFSNARPNENNHQKLMEQQSGHRLLGTPATYLTTASRF
jgi:hypothetical protein